MRFSRIEQVALSTVVLLMLCGCGDGGLDEAKQWIKETRQSTKVAIPKLAEPKRFTPFAYAGKSKIDPFSQKKLAAAFDRLKPKTSDESNAPNPDRPREPMEAYSLDTLRMVGTLQKPGLTYALLQVDKVIFQVKVGNYVGQNDGMITSITDTEVELSERVQDAAGVWVVRKAKLELQETKK
jgi:type IV pilus assembly protein PilP